MEQKTKYNTAAVDGVVDARLEGVDVAIVADNSIQSNQLIDMIENNMIDSDMKNLNIIDNLKNLNIGSNQYDDIKWLTGC